MANPDSTTTPPSHSRRRSSLSVSELLAAHRGSSSTDTGPSVRNAHPSMTSAATQAAQQPHARRLSITTLGLSGAGGTASSTGQASATTGRSNSIFEAVGIRKGIGRHTSISEHQNESAVVDDMDTVSPPPGAGIGAGSPGGSMGRRLSSGAKAYRDVRTTSGGNSMVPGYGAAQQSPNSTVKTRKWKHASCNIVRLHYVLRSLAEGFNWSENLRTRAQRTSISAGAGDAMTGAHARTRSTANSEPVMPRPAPPVMAAPAPAPAPAPKPRGLFEFEGGKPDPMQERILRGQFLD